jgi:hypothetical protein
MQKRRHKRRPVRLEARLFWGKTAYPGIVTSLSEKGMFICTKMSPPSDSVLEAVLHIKDKHLKVPVNVKWTVKMDGAQADENSGIGVEILDVPRTYTEFFNNLEAD